MDVLLQEGHLIELDFLKVDGELIKFKSLVDNMSSDDLISVYAPMYRGATYPVVIGDAYKVFYSRLNRNTGKYDVYSFDAQVVSRLRKDNIAMVRLKKTSDVILVQRRDTYRLSFVKKMAITYRNKPGQPTFEILSKDISVGGMRGVVSQPVEVGAELCCHLFLSEEEQLDFNGVVLSAALMEDSRLKYDVRIQFHRADSKTMKRLVAFINKAQADMIKKVSIGRHERLMRQTLGDRSYTSESNRKKPDAISKWVNYAPLVLWLLFATALLIFASGMPATEYPLQRFFNFVYRRGWNYSLLQSSLVLFGITLVLSLVSVAFNRMRLKRSYDYFRTTYFIIAILSVLLLVIISVLLATQA